MEQGTRPTKWLRERKFFTVLPVLLLPFMALFFWALGGGQIKEVESKTTAKEGLNTTLPGAHLNDKDPLDKLSYYNMAAKDSARWMEQIKNDPYYNPTYNLESDSNSSLSFNDNDYGSGEAILYRKLNKLDSLLKETVEKPKAGGDNYSSKKFLNDEGTNDEDFEKLEKMIRAINQPGGRDPELEQLNGMLEKIMDIQHPGRVEDRIKEVPTREREPVIPLSAASDDVVSLLDNSSSSGDKDAKANETNVVNRFYSLEENDKGFNQKQNAIEAKINETQALVDGSIVKLVLVEDTYMNGVLVPRNSFIYGATSLHGERLDIKINSILSKNSIFPVSLSVYDLDGIKGIYVPGAITRNVLKESAGRAAQGIGMTTLDPSIGAQAASAGIETARNLLNKRVKLVKVTVKAGYRVLLYNDNEKINNEK